MSEQAVIVGEIFDSLSTEVSVPSKGIFKKSENKLVEIKAEDVAKGCIGLCFVFDSVENAVEAFPDSAITPVATKEQVNKRIEELQKGIDASMDSIPGFSG